MRSMGIDFGDSRIGIALSDPSGIIASGYETIQANVGWKKYVRRICEIAEQNSVSAIVIGLPKMMNNTLGDRAEITAKFEQRLKKYLPETIDVFLWDERLTTVSALKMMNESNLKSDRKKEIVDQVAASYILQGWLDSRRKE